ncbi:hypothetical protein [Streptomyces melanosporofaciens]|uniref:Uncharacterized protein n=1 Tax=Streptomyces melanosporofaciens TaxID=67327 RepID=A0A1H4ID00_STRMJ|nr:hypothetical protein [Streptomyces melanosporofaciens]SEB31813.1 hypothetical protein SAMN04490356_0516 [Streptomyces melanosporofaciens]
MSDPGIGDHIGDTPGSGSRSVVPAVHRAAPSPSKKEITMSSATLESVIDFILNQADEGSVEKVFAAGNQRMATLINARAAQVTEGATVRLTGLKPKYLNGLQGEVVELTRERKQIIAVVLLDETSTTEFSFHREIDPETQRHRVRVPAGTCKVL